jgi:hypothetical protein
MRSTDPEILARGHERVCVVRPHQGQIVGAEDAVMVIKISSDETGGSWALLAGSSTPRFESALHRHAEGD